MTIIRTTYRQKRREMQRRIAMGEGPAVVALRIATVAAVIVLALSQVSGCASITAYEASHPYQKFPGRGGGGGGTGG